MTPDPSIALESVEIAANRPLALEDPASVWTVRTGEVHVFAVTPAGERHYVLSAGAGDAVFGVAPITAPAALGLIATGVPDTHLDRRPRGEFVAALGRGAGPQDTALARWVERLSAAMRDRLPPARYAAVASGRETTLAAEGDAAKAESGLIWTSVLEGRVLIDGVATAALAPGDPPFPLSDEAWLHAASPARLQGLSTDAARADVAAGLDVFHAAALAGIARLIGLERGAEAERLTEQATVDERAVRRGIARLVAAFGPSPRGAAAAAEFDDPLLAACAAVGRAMGITIKAPPHAAPAHGTDPLARIAQASRVRVRMVRLEDGWWRHDNGPLLVRKRDASAPAAALQPSSGRYELVDPASGARVAVTRGVAATLEPDGWSFYRRLPDRPLRVLDLLRFSLPDIGRDLGVVAAMGIAGGLLGLAVPVATGYLVDRVIPAADHRQLLVLALALAAGAFGAAAFQATRSLAFLRIEGRMSGSLQAAVWDRLIDLPAPFFRQYPSGDLGLRAMGIEAIRQAVTGALVTSVLGTLISVFSFALLFVYDVRLALFATALLVLTLVVTVGVNAAQLPLQRALYRQNGRVTNLVLQLLTGIAKLRVAGAEARAFGVWADGFGEQSTLTRSAQTLAIGLNVFYAAFPLIGLMVLFGAVTAFRGGLSTGAFLAFYAAYGQVVAAVLSMGAAITATLQVIPIYERAQPILRGAAETDEGKVDPGELTGAVDLSRVTFRYRPDGPAVLDDVSLRAAPGEFVALVGPSGAGKTSIFRLLMGFERPEAGAVLYDHQDLADLDVRAVRRQIGVVLQNAKVVPGDIYTNIVGASRLTLEDAWAAARMAGLDEDIRRMPMGMQTFIMEGGGNFSGGQRQRLMIARALVRRPRLLMFDEATSALDNETQATVSRSLGALHATRLVIAHRLSTVMKADRIYVLQAGRIVQTGTFEELMREEDGLFVELAKRQLV
ncbi:MAG TPA: NHLP bacteriocin export ABC transporter permease/ATPase subunit [bacterium]|nr:NHLP bacteriocin export ABC transporter permease/ATPase subunit [bacterium]